MESIWKIALAMIKDELNRQPILACPRSVNKSAHGVINQLPIILNEIAVCCQFPMKNVLALVVVPVLALAAQTVFADVLVDRGLPSTGVFATDGSGNVDWPHRSNIGTGDYDAKDPINATNGWRPEVPGDDFTLPATASSYHMTDLRLWLSPNGTTSFSNMFNSVSLMLGQGTGATATLSVLAVTPSVSSVTFPGTSYPLWQLDYPLDLTAPGGTGYSFAVYADGKACNNAGGNGESNYIAFADCTMRGYSGGYPNDSSDGYVKDFYLDGTFADKYTFPEVWGGVRAGDISVQVFGTAVPEPSTLALVGLGAAALMVFRSRK
jgi:hypothetical protein